MNNQKLSNISLKTFRSFLIKVGCEKEDSKRGHGGHDKWVKPGLTRPIILQTHVDPIPERIIKNTLQNLGITKSEYFKMMNIKGDKYVEPVITINMELTLKRKSVDLPENILRYLAAKAAEKKTSLKKYMESILIHDVEDMDDEETYAYLSKTRPDGHVMLNEEEQNDFEKKYNL